MRLLDQILPRDADPMDVLRTAVSVLSHFDPDRRRPAHGSRRQRAEGRAADRPDGDGGRLLASGSGRA